LDPKDGGQRWWDLSGGAGAVLPQVLGGAGWQETLLSLHECARAQARSQFAERLGGPLEEEGARLREWERQVAAGRGRNAEAGEEQAALESVREAITNWNITIDAVGFLSINGRLHELARTQ
jgi:hypothetical protein